MACPTPIRQSDLSNPTSEPLDTPPIRLACSGCGGGPDVACPRGHYCSERVKAAVDYDIALAVELLPGGMRVCKNVVAQKIHRSRHLIRCEARVPFYSGCCPHCGAVARVTLPEPARRRIVEALAESLRGPTGVPLFGGVLHHLHAWGFRAIRLYLEHRVHGPSFVARVAMQKLGAPRQAVVLFDAIDHVVEQWEAGVRVTTYGKEVWREKPDSRPDRVESDPEDVAFYRQHLLPARELSVFEVVHAIPNVQAQDYIGDTF